jgi:N-acyl-L-homoserine lactone synthetase
MTQTKHLVRQGSVRPFSPSGYNPFYATLTRTEYPILGTNYIFRVLNAQEDVDNGFRLRHDVFCKEIGIINPEEFPDGMEVDDYDDNSLHTALFEDGRMVAYARLVLPCNMFPIERTNILPKKFERGRSAEISRGAVVKDRRHGDITWHMFNNAYSLCQESGLDALLSFSNATMYNGFRKRNVPFRYIGEPVIHHGHKSYPLIIPIEHGTHVNFTRQ